MSIGSTIKRLRREKDITQEGLAEYLGITSRAISQWECGRTAPDISQIPILCNVLNVSADILLGIDIVQKDKRIRQLLDEAKKHSELGYYTKGEELLRDANREFPNNFEIMFDLMDCIWRTRDLPERASERDTLTKEVIYLGEKILSECTDEKIRACAIQLLCFTYPDIKETQKAIALAEQMPGRYLTRESLLSSIYHGDKKYEIIRSELLFDISDLYVKMLLNNSPLDNGEHPFSNDEIIDIHKKYLAVMDIFFEDENYGFCRQVIGWSNISLAACYMRANKHEKALECLKVAQKHSVISDTEYDSKAKYTSLLFRGMEFGGIVHNISENDCLHQLNEMEAPVFDAIRNTAEFIEIENELKKYAGKH